MGKVGVRIERRTAQATGGHNPPRSLYDRIGAFLIDQHLDPDPANYAFAYHLLADPEGPLASAVATLIDGGVRLTQRDIDSLGTDLRPINRAAAQTEKAQTLVAQTQIQVEGFQDMVTAMRVETEDFGRDLAASAEAISLSSGSGSPATGQIVQLTAAMLERIRTAEARMNAATREASDLRAKLEEARDNARRDPLTGLANRRAFEEAYAAHVATGAPCCLAVCDVDHFKSVNDRFGHAVGDRVLKAISAALSETCNGHLVARYGGEEFAILFTGIDAQAACNTLDTARATVAAKRYRLRETDAPLGAVTISAGLSPRQQADSFHSIFQRADKLLYRAKEAGRNCIEHD